MIRIAGTVTALLVAGLGLPVMSDDVTAPSAAASSNPEPPPPPSKPECPVLARGKNATSVPTDKAAVQPTAKNTVWFDHYWLRPSCDRPMVLSVEDGEYFQVIILHTDTTQFNYTITAVPDQDVPTSTSGATGAGLTPIRWSDMSLTMQHSKTFARYRVTISLRPDLGSPPGRTTGAGERVAGGPPAAGAPASGRIPELFPATFDVWVKTSPSFEVAFLGGVAFSGLRSPHYVLRTDDHGTPDTKDDTQTVEEDATAKDGFAADTIAVSNLRFPSKLKGFGLAFGIGLNHDSDPRYFFGPSYFFGRHFLLHAGWAGGRVDRLPDGQEIHKPPINGDATLSSLPKRFASAFYASVSFGFVPGAEDAFKGAFGSTQKAANPGTSTQNAPEPPTNAPKVDLSKVAGTYVSSDKSTRTVTITGSSHADWRITVSGAGPDGKAIGPELTLAHTESATFADESNKHVCNFSERSDGLTFACLDEQHDPKTNKDELKKTFEGKRKP